MTKYCCCCCCLFLPQNTNTTSCWSCCASFLLSRRSTLSLVLRGRRERGRGTRPRVARTQRRGTRRGGCRASRAKTTTWLGGSALNRRGRFPVRTLYECQRVLFNVRQRPTRNDVNDDDEDTTDGDRRMLNSASSSFVHAGVKRVFVTRGPEGISAVKHVVFHRQLGNVFVDDGFHASLMD